MNKYYIVWNSKKTHGFVTTDYQIAYEVRKGAASNCFNEYGEPDELAQEFCRLHSENEDCTMETVNND